jgi:NAD(P)-dependent dehydrogenase (short-subunit alcohol dehydrogenase family)
MKIWIIGASSGIGRALALRLLARGWSLAVSGRDEQALRDLRRDADEAAERCFPVVTDVTDPTSLRRAAEQVVQQLGVPDCCILNAGSYHPMPLEEFSAERLRQLTEVNFFGVANALEVLMPLMLARGAGQILVTASLAGYRGLPNAPDYCASKAATIALVESLQPSLAERGVSIRLINPGFVRTRLTDKNPFPMPALIEPEEAAKVIERGLLGTAFEIDFPRRFSWVMKLLRVLPDRLFLRLSRRLLS